MTTIQELKLHVWRRLGLRRHLAGRKTIDDFVELSIQHWEAEPLSHCMDEQQRTIVCESIVASVKRGYQVVSGKEPNEYGIVWVIVLQAIASLVVQIILHWWLDRKMNRVRMLIWQQELTR